MAHFLDTIAQTPIKYKGYIKQLEMLLSKRDFSHSTLDAIEHGFVFWPLNRGHDNFQEFREKVGIAKIVNKCCTSGRISKDEFMYYIEYYLNILQIPAYSQDPFYESTNNSAIYSVVFRIIEEIDCEVISSEYGLKVVTRNVLVAIAKEITKSKYNLDKDLYLYTHRSNKNNLIGKADILCRIYKYLEGFSDKINQYDFKEQWRDIGKLMDGLDIRHAPNKKEKEILDGMKKSEVLEWYDQLFNMCLSLIILINYRTNRKDIKELKNKLG